MQMGMEIVGGGPVQSVRMLGTQQMGACVYIHPCVCHYVQCMQRHLHVSDVCVTANAASGICWSIYV